ncbi:sigma-70 family RNA polymerase sigma factor [bacterium]|jgi:RNA polymerase sigma-70 factor, ECF subfamily|nr:sigma-70 family RNA polymerase sigma factor [bacterium]
MKIRNNDNSQTSSRDSQLSDWLVLSQDGDAIAYQRFLEKVYHLMVRFLSAKFRDKTQMADVIQDIMIGIHTARHTYLPSRPIMPWLMAIARYKTIDHWKKLGRNKSFIPDDEFYFSDIEDSRNNVSHQETLIILEESLVILPKKQKELISFVKLKGHTVQEAADTFGMSVSNVKTTVHRAMKKLQETHSNDPR